MSRPKLNDPVIADMQSKLEGLYQLEYAIRIIDAHYPEQLKIFQSINKRIRSHLLDYVLPLDGEVEKKCPGISGVIQTFGITITDEMIDNDNLLSECWDQLQLGYIGERIDIKWYVFPEKNIFVWAAIQDVINVFSDEVARNYLPGTHRFRIFDLLNGNDIPGVIQQVNNLVNQVQLIKTKENKEGNCIASEPAKLNKLNARVPVFVYPGAIQHIHFRENEGDEHTTHLGVNLKLDMKLYDILGAVREFLYQYALFRKNSQFYGNDQVVERLLEAYSLPLVEGRAQAGKINTWLVPLIGLFCWDKREEYGGSKRGALTKAVEDARRLLNKTEDDDPAIRQSYEKIKNRIERFHATWPEV